MGERQRTVENVVIIMLDFYKGKRVFVTGHTGFKGSWLCVILAMTGAEVTGFSLPPTGEPNLYALADIDDLVDSRFGDVRDLDALKAVFDSVRPEIVFHLAAQPIVRESYRDPVGTYSTNVMGTVHLLDCVRQSDCVHSVLNVTTDKVYRNNEWCWGYRENEPLGGYDPYSNSKSCSELVTHSYVDSFLAKQNVAVSTARAGNVIGGGDFAKDRIIPDCVRAACAREPIGIRNPYSVRPYQHVFEPLFAYLLIARRQYEDASLMGNYNIGPDERDCMTTGELTELFCRCWGEGLRWENRAEANAPHEANYLRLDCGKLKSTFGWRPRWNIERAVEKTVEWTKAWRDGENVREQMERQIGNYIAEE